MRSERQVHDRLDGCIMERDAALNPMAYDPYRAAVLQGWVYALSWTLELENPSDRSSEIKTEMARWDGPDPEDI